MVVKSIRYPLDAHVEVLGPDGQPVKPTYQDQYAMFQKVMTPYALQASRIQAQAKHTDAVELLNEAFAGSTIILT